MNHVFPFASFFLRPLCVALVALFMLGACASDKEESENAETPIAPVDDLYNEAQDAFAAKNYKLAVEKFELVEQQHPYSEWATRAQVMAAYSNYRMEEYDDAVVMLERFIKLHPGNENIEYVYYLLSLCYYEQITDVGRDQSMTMQAKRALEEVARRFPDSEYARDALLKLDLVNNHLAGKEMEVGRYYLKRGDVLAAINRFKAVLDNYETTTHAPEALHRLTEAYLTLGVKDEALKYAAVLGYNYPSSPWYQDSYHLLAGGDKGKMTEEETRSFWQRWLSRSKE